MLRFKLHEIRLGLWTHLLMPKLNENQLEWIAGKLTNIRFRVERGSTLVARRKEVTIHLNPSGHCWSSSDPGDFVIPLIPEILGFPKQRVPLAEFKGRYFRVSRSENKALVRLTTRMESAKDWELLRATGQCALSPDEKIVASTLIRSSRGGCTLLTDFPVDDGGVRVIGNRQYYESFLESEDAVAMLREVGRTRTRNSYVPGNGFLRLRTFVPPSSNTLRAISEELGEWCYFTLA
jgi:hypothetical protein